MPSMRAFFQLHAGPRRHQLGRSSSSSSCSSSRTISSCSTPSPHFPNQLPGPCPSLNFHAAVNLRHSRGLAVSSSNSNTGFPGAPDLASLNKAGLSNAMIMARILQDSHKRPMPQPGQAEEDAAREKPNDPITPEDFVDALECIVKTRTNEPNPDTLTEIIQEVVETGLLEKFTPQQLVVTLKDLAVFCVELPPEFLLAIVQQLGRHMTSYDVTQLSNIAWALMRVVPVADEELRVCLGLDDSWLQQYYLACEEQLQQIVSCSQQQQQQDQQQQQQRQQRVKLPTGQQLANLLLVPAAVGRPFSAPGQQLFEAAMVLCQLRLCGMAVAQTCTCYIRLQLQPGQELLEALLTHFCEDLQLYDHDEITQVAVAAAVLQLQLPSTLLADATQRVDMLQQSGRAHPEDVEVLQRAMDMLARTAAAAAAASSVTAVPA